MAVQDIKGEFYLDVEADAGEWRITIRQPQQYTQQIAL